MWVWNRLHCSSFQLSMCNSHEKRSAGRGKQLNIQMLGRPSLTRSQKKGRKAKTRSLVVPRKTFPRTERWCSVITKKAALQRVQTLACLVPGCWPTLCGAYWLPSHRGRGNVWLPRKHFFQASDREKNKSASLLGGVRTEPAGTSEGWEAVPRVDIKNPCS